MLPDDLRALVVLMYDMRRHHETLVNDVSDVYMSGIVQREIEAVKTLIVSELRARFGLIPRHRITLCARWTFSSELRKRSDTKDAFAEASV